MAGAASTFPLSPRRWRALLAALLMQGAVAGAREMPRLVLPDGRDWLQPDGTLTLLLPAALARVSERLRLELDAIDVTELVTSGEGRLDYRSPQPLDPGPHELRLVEFADNGDIRERGLWRFEVRQSAAFREMSLRPAGEFAYQRRVSERNLDPSPPAGVEQASLRLDGGLADAAYRLTATGALVHDGALERDQTQLYEFLLGVDRGPARLRLGRHAVEGGSLIRQDFRRRGLSLGLRRGRLALDVYAQRTATLAGVGNPTGLNDRDRLTTGITARFSPLAQDPQRLVLSAGYLSGRGREEGVAEEGDGGAGGDGPGGTAWQVGLDSYHLGGRLRLYGEYARSEYDFDGVGTGFAADSDEAFLLLGQYQPSGGGALDWNASLQLQQVGTDFRSPANAALPNDKRVLQGVVQATLGGLSGTLLLGLERDNLDDRRAFPTIASRVLNLDLAWSPAQQAAPAAPLGRVFANPVYQLSYAQVDNRQVDDPLLYLGDDTDNTNRDLSLSAAFAPGAWNWSLEYRLNRFDEDAGVLSSTRSDLLGLALSLPLAEGLSLAPTLQAGRGEERATGARTDERLASLALAFARGPLTASLDYSFSRSKVSDGSLDRRGQVLGLAVGYRLVPPRPGRPGLDLFMNANWADADEVDQVQGIAPSRQIYLGLRVGGTPDQGG